MLAERLKTLRQKANLTQEEIAKNRSFTSSV